MATKIIKIYLAVYPQKYFLPLFVVGNVQWA